MNFTNYRIVQYSNENGEGYYQIQQVIYDDSGKPKQLVEMQTPQSQSVEAIKNLLVHQIASLTLPVLDSTIFNRNTKESTNAALNLLKGKKDDIQSGD